MPALSLSKWGRLFALSLSKGTACLLLSLLPLAAEDGYRLWLRYDNLPRVESIVLTTPSGTDSPTIRAARDELQLALGATTRVSVSRGAGDVSGAGAEGYLVRTLPNGWIEIAANSDLGALYGSFALLRHLQTHPEPAGLNFTSAPRISRRLLNHWDNLNGFVERGYAGFSLWQWFYLPEIRDSRYRDYARALASVGLNGTVLTNVNANALVLTPDYLAKVAALAEEFRPYGVRVYLTARFSAPMEIGSLKTADPLDPAVAAWWKAKVNEIYRYVPDFGGFVVKANSEGQPGPQDYKRTHADGANMLADALAPHGGIVMWRAFVYAADLSVDRVKQAQDEFQPLDGKFRDNVSVQIKNGPLDFMPREPFSPLLGSLAKTPMTLELQITQEYLGQSTQLAYLAPMWKETLDADTFARGEPVESAKGPGSTIARAIDGSLHGHKLTVIAGVANTGDDRNWTGHPLAQANWYAFGRLAWDHTLSSEAIAAEWTRLTFGHEPVVVETITKLLLGSHETLVNYSMPLGLHHIMSEGHHYGPAPWVKHPKRDDWSSTYYHQADQFGLGAARSEGGSNAVAQYAPPLAKLWGNPDTCPETLLLWFHHVAWDRKLKSGRTLWDGLCLRYQQGVDEVRAMRRAWDSLAGKVDAERFTNVQQRLQRQEQDAVIWRDACLLYFQTFSRRPLPASVEKPAHDLDYYKAIKIRHAPGWPADH